MVPVIPGQGIVCSEEIIGLRIFILDSLFTLPSVNYAYCTTVLCVYGCWRVCVCMYVLMYVYDQL